MAGQDGRLPRDLTACADTCMRTPFSRVSGPWEWKLKARGEEDCGAGWTPLPIWGQIMAPQLRFILTAESAAPLQLRLSHWGGRCCALTWCLSGLRRSEQESL